MLQTYRILAHIRSVLDSADPPVLIKYHFQICCLVLGIGPENQNRLIGKIFDRLIELNRFEHADGWMDGWMEGWTAE